MAFKKTLDRISSNAEYCDSFFNIPVVSFIGFNVFMFYFLLLWTVLILLANFKTIIRTESCTSTVCLALHCCYINLNHLLTCPWTTVYLPFHLHRFSLKIQNLVICVLPYFIAFTGCQQQQSFYVLHLWVTRACLGPKLSGRSIIVTQVGSLITVLWTPERSQAFI